MPRPYRNRLVSVRKGVWLHYTTTKSGAYLEFLAPQDDCKVYYKPFAVGLLNHRQLEQASFDKPRMSRHQ